MHKTPSNNAVFNYFRNLRLTEKLFVQGLIVTVILIFFQAWLNNARISFMSYLPPIGLAFFFAVEYLVQPLVLGAVNITIINSLFKTKGWQVGFWLNGLLLLLAFSTVNLVLKVTFNLPFLPAIVIIDLLLCFPFGCLAKFSNGGWSKPLD